MKMLREARSASSLEVIDGFRQRGMEVSRLESFSDAVFGFALTLLVVSLDVPRTADDLFKTMLGFPAFAICFTFLALIWNSHYKFCRRYGLTDGRTRFLTCLMLFFVLFYVYPLKFLFNLNANVGYHATGMTLAQTRLLFFDLWVGVRSGLFLAHPALSVGLWFTRRSGANATREIGYAAIHLPPPDIGGDWTSGRMRGAGAVVPGMERLVLSPSFSDRTRGTPFPSTTEKTFNWSQILTPDLPVAERPISPLL